MATIGQIAQQHRANKENAFYTSLMQYAMEGNTIPLPDKSVLWNQFVQMKGGRLSPQDITQFEQTFSQVKGAKYQQQLGEFYKMSMAGESDKDIRKKIKEDPIQYKNLLDMITNLEKSGTEEGIMQAQNAKRFLPDIDKGGALGGLYEEPGMIGRVGAPIGLAATAYAGQKLLERPEALIKEARKTYKTKIGDVRKDIKSTRETIKTNKETLKKKKKTLKNPKKSKVVKGLQSQNRVLNKELKDLVAKNKKIKFKQPPRRYQDLLSKTKGGGLPAAILGGTALTQLPAAGEYLGGEEGRGVGETARDVGLLGWGLAGLRGLPASTPYTAALKAVGYAPIAYMGGKSLYDKYIGDEE